MNGCKREGQMLLADAETLTAPEWAHHLSGCAECRQSLRVRSLLRADGEQVRAAARLPSAETVLWRLRLRSARQERIRVALLISFANVTAASILAFLVLARLWVALRGSAPEPYDEFTAVVVLVTILAIGIVAVAVWMVRHSVSHEVMYSIRR